MAPRLSEADQSLIHVYARLYDDDAMKDLRHMAENDDHAVNAEMDALPEDADEATRQDLAERLTRASLLAHQQLKSAPAAENGAKPGAEPE